MKRFCVLFLLFVLFGNLLTINGQSQRGSASGRITAEDGQSLPGATVSFASDKTLTRRIVITDSNGEFRAVGLDPADNYVMTATLDGFSGVRMENVKVKAGKDTAVNAELQLAEVAEELIVTAESPVVDVTSSTTGQDLTLELTESLPTARSYRDYLQLVPGLQATMGQSSDLDTSDIKNFPYFEGIYIRDRSDTLESLYLDLPLPAGQKIDSVQLKGNWKTDFTLKYGPLDWSFEQDGQKITAEGPPRESFVMRLDTNAAGKDSLTSRLENKEVKVEAKYQNKTVFKDNLPVSIAPKYNLNNDLEKALNFPYQIIQGEWFMMSTPTNTFRTGNWDLFFSKSFTFTANEEPPRRDPMALRSIGYTGIISPSLTPSGSELSSKFFDFFLVAPPKNLTSGDKLRLTYTDHWNETIIDTLLDQTVIAPPPEESCKTELTSSAPRVFAGNRLCVCGCFPDPKSWFSLDLDGKRVSPAAATSSMILVQIPESTAPGVHTINLNDLDGKPVKQIKFLVLQVAASIDQNRLWTGQSTTLRLRVIGTNESLPIELTNRTPETITVEGGLKQVTDTSGGAENKIEKTVRGIKKGAFSIDYKLNESPCPCLKKN